MEKFPAYCIKGELLGANDATLNAAECYGNGQHGFLPAVFAPSPCPKHQRRQSRQRRMTIPAYTALQASHKSRWRNFPFFWSKEVMKLPLSMPVGRHSLKKMEQELSSPHGKCAAAAILPSGTSREGILIFAYKKPSLRFFRSRRLFCLSYSGAVSSCCTLL